METSVLIPSNDMSRHVNEIVETIPENVFDAFKHLVVQYNTNKRLKITIYMYT